MSLVWGLSAVLLALTAVVDAQHNVTVEESDPTLLYTPSISAWYPSANPQKLTNGTLDGDYFHGGGYVAIGLPGATVSFTFNGSYIAYYSDQNNNHGSMTVALDSKTTTLSSYNADSVPQVKLFEAFVDPDVPNHTITLTCLEFKNIGLDYFLYTAAPGAVISSSNTESSSSPVPTQGPTSPRSTVTRTAPATVTIVAAILAAIGWTAAFVFAFLFLRLLKILTRISHQTESGESQIPGTCVFPPITASALSKRTIMQSPPAYSEDR
ncbi:hypothetical protein EXIGLDRAFT_726435 [Exidia glandulosa HHB12029]|uniref:Uncharacterized protein n=1 Tax=Exidia glandulosa HHB12029 TaxID=1314781 RepID=A0A165DPW2_EXIGL|nr:hypothetical protein EXIGLDRAFT_726435 [Exidia glandulosa HHB12029]